MFLVFLTPNTVMNMRNNLPPNSTEREKTSRSRRIYWHTTFMWAINGSGGDYGKLKNDATCKVNRSYSAADTAPS